MKYTLEQIKDIAMQIMKDIAWPYDESKGIRPFECNLEQQIKDIDSQKNHPRFDDYITLLFPYWDVHIDFPADDGWGDRNMMWILIKDETGEPYEIGHRQWKGRIVKNTDGKYQIEDYK